MDSSPIPLGVLPLMLTAALLLHPSSRRSPWAAIGVVVFALGIVALGVVLGSEPFGSPPPWQALAAAPRAFLSINGGLLLVGAVLAAWPAPVGASHGMSRWVSTIAAFVALLLVWPAIAAGRLGYVLVSALSLAAAGLAMIGLCRFLRIDVGVTWLDRTVFDRAQEPPARPSLALPDSAAVAGLMIGVCFVAWGHSLLLVCGGALSVAILAQLLGRRWKCVPRFPALPAGALALVPVLWLLLTVSGPQGGELRALQQAPLSPAAEVVLIPPLVVAAWAFLGLWPLHGVMPGPLLAPIGGLLLLRIGVALVPGGMAHWQPVIVPLAVVGTWHGALVRRPALVLTGLGILGIASLHGSGGLGGMVSLAAAAAVDLETRFLRVAGPSIPAGWMRLGWLVPAWSGLLVLDASLRAQVFYTVAAWAALVVGLGLDRARDSGSPRGL